MRIEWKRRLIMMGIIAGVYVGYRYLIPAIIPFLAAWVLASWLEPVTAKIETRLKIKKTLAGTILLAFLSILAGTVLYIGIRELFFQIRTAVERFPAAAEQCLKLLDECCLALERATGILKEDSRSYILRQMDGMQEHMLTVISTDAFGTVLSWAKGALFFISGTVITFISTILIVGDMERLRRKIWDYSWLVGTRRVVKRLQQTTITYLKAQVFIIIMVGAVCSAAFWMMGSPYFLILGIVLGILDAVPLIGTGTFLYPSALVFLIRGDAAIAVGCVLLDIMTSLLREFMEPRLLGTKLGVSPIVILASVYLGVVIFGGLGVILGPLSFSTIYEIGREWDVWD